MTFDKDDTTYAVFLGYVLSYSHLEMRLIEST